jgi:DNA-binding NtrC family response regulator
MELVRRTAPVDVSVMISGETGTGKELIARLIHKLSPRAAGEFVALDCNAIPATVLESELFGHERGAFTGADQPRVGVFELANGTSLFLDEIANLPLQEQSKLLRVLQERSFRRIGGRRLIPSDFRLITATNADLAACVRARSFREDLFYRLSVVHIHLPPLRERREDIPLLVSHFVGKKRLRLKRPEVCRVSHRAVDLLTSYNWPGNIRELENVLENAILNCPGDTIEEADLVLATHIAPPGPSGDGDDTDVPFRVARQRALAMFERLYLLTNLRQQRGSIKKTALHAAITTKHVRELMRRHGIERRDFRPALRARPALPADSSTATTGTRRRRV